ncbi:MAG: hypothetical protein FWG79_05505 [Bacteroidales bacterium]|nr:hypothetical protein [Bacteroidales bacterium]
MKTPKTYFDELSEDINTASEPEVAYTYACTRDVTTEKRIENPAKSGGMPEGYMTVEQFRTESKNSLTKILNEHGIY